MALAVLTLRRPSLDLETKGETAGPPLSLLTPAWREGAEEAEPEWRMLLTPSISEPIGVR